MIVQWELARKHTAVWPATARSVFWEAWFELSVAGRLAASAFSPAPSVDAAVLRARRRGSPRVSPEEHDAYRRFVADAFGARRPLAKALGRQVSPHEFQRLAPVLGFDPAAHPRDLDPRQWAALFAFALARGDRLRRA